DLEVLAPEKAAEAKRGVIIPAEFTANVLARKPTKLVLFSANDAPNDVGVLIEARLFRTLAAVNGRLVEHAMQHNGTAPTEAALLQLTQQPSPVSSQSSHAGRRPRPVSFSFSLPANLVAYLMINLLIFGGASVAHQRSNGMLRRLVVSPLTR